MIKKFKRTVIFCLDGATFDLILPWIDEEILPNLKRLMVNGVWGELESVHPPLSCPAWISFKTGKNPGKLGIFDFLVRVKNQYSLKPSMDISKFTAFWDLLSQNDIEVGIFNLPTTYPPKKVNGFIVTSMFTPTTSSNYSYPPQLKSELNKLTNGYIIDIPQQIYLNKEQKFISDIDKLLIQRKKVILYLLKKYNPQLFIITFTSSDRIQHYMWKHMDVNHPDYNPKVSPKYQNSIRNYWRKLDKILGEIISNFNKEDNLFIISDHGFGIQDIKFNINDWLVNKSFLKIKKQKKNILSKIGISSESILKFLSKLQIFDFIAKFLLRFINKRSLFKLYEKLSFKYIPFDKMKEKINWDNTVAYSLHHSNPFNHIYINVKGRDPNGIVESDEYDSIRRKIIKELLNLNKTTLNGKRIDIEILKQDNIYSGPFVNKAPDIIFTINKGAGVSVNSFGHNKLIEEGSIGLNQNASHRMNGIFIAYGKDIDKNKKIYNAKITDIAPTILHMFSIPIPDDIDGEVLMDIFKEKSILKSNKVIYFKPEDEKYRIKRKIVELKESGKI